jgi:hypothetical protein
MALTVAVLIFFTEPTPQSQFAKQRRYENSDGKQNEGG